MLTCLSQSFLCTRSSPGQGLLCSICGPVVPTVFGGLSVHKDPGPNSELPKDPGAAYSRGNWMICFSGSDAYISWSSTPLSRFAHLRGLAGLSIPRNLHWFQPSDWNIWTAPWYRTYEGDSSFREVAFIESNVFLFVQESFREDGGLVQSGSLCSILSAFFRKNVRIWDFRFVLLMLQKPSF